MTVPVSDLQAVNPTAIIELFQLAYDEVIHHKEWVASEAVSVNVIRRASVRRGFVLKCRTAGTTGATEPDWYSTFTTERDVNTYDPKVDPYDFLDGSVLWRVVPLTKYYFHNNANQTASVTQAPDGTNVIRVGDAFEFDGIQYQILPIEATGFEYKVAQAGSLPRPTITASNLFGTISAILLDVNESVLGNDLTTAKVTRIRTLAKYADAANFASIDLFATQDGDGFLTEDGFLFNLEHGENPYGTPDPSQRFPDEVYYVDRKVSENRDFVRFELASVFDLAGVKVPKRQVLPSIFPTVGSFK